jgi:hypothetical protein
MATSYDTIHNRAIGKISDDGLAKYDTTTRQEILDDYLKSATFDFLHACTNYDLSDCDDSERQFTDDLSGEVIEILATGEAYYWCLPKVNNAENFYNLISTKDASFFSPANLLDKMITLKESLETDFKRKINLYTFHVGKIDELKA